MAWLDPSWMPTLLCAASFIEDRADAAASRIADDVDVLGRVEHAFDRPPQGCAVTGHVGVDAELVPFEEDRAAVTADVAADDDGIARFCQGARSLDAVHNLTDAGRRNEEVVDLALTGNFRITGNDAHAGFGCRFGHGLGVGFDFFPWENLLQ